MVPLGSNQCDLRTIETITSQQEEPKSYHSYCSCGGSCYSGNGDIMVEISNANCKPLKYDTIQEDEVVMFHGTSTPGSILSEGFQAKYCTQPSIGVGTYLSTCIRHARAMGDYVLMCKVKLGKLDERTTLDPNYQIPEGCDGAYYIHKDPIDGREHRLEYCVADDNRIKIVGVLKAV